MAKSDAQLERILAEILEQEETGDVDYDAIVEIYPDYETEIRSFLADRKQLDLTGLAPKAVFGDQPTLAHGQVSNAETTRIRYFGDYQLISEIARGGMGVVYRARQTTLDRIVAVKMILSGALASEDDVRRFRSEAESAAQLDHPNIVPIFEIGEHNNQHYFSMALIEGRSIAEVIVGGPMIPRDAAQIVCTTATAVQYAHRAGVIHRDLKPSNILLDQNNQPKITDFGLAKRADKQGLTTTGDLLGTPGYMSPEQARGQNEETNEATDIYGLGAILYAALTGRPPFQAAGVIETVTQVIERDPVSPRQLNADVPVDLQVICLKCLQKAPTRRYQTAGELADDLDRFMAGRPILARPVSGIERSVKWIKRRPAIAGLMATTCVVAVLGIAGIVNQWRKAESARAIAETAAINEGHARALADDRASALAVAEKETRDELHTSNLLRGDMLLETGRVVEAEKLYWQEHSNPPGDDQRRSKWRLIDLYSRFPKTGQLPVLAKYLVDGAGLIAAVEKNELHVFDGETGIRLHMFQSPIGHLYRPAFSPDGMHVACGHLGSAEIFVWNMDEPDQDPLTIVSARTARKIGGVAGSIGTFIGRAILSPEQRKQSSEITQIMANHTPDLLFLDDNQLLSNTLSGLSIWNAHNAREIRFFNLPRASFSFESTFVGLSSDKTTLFLRNVLFEDQIILRQLLQFDLDHPEIPPRLLGLDDSKLTTFEVASLNTIRTTTPPKLVSSTMATISKDGRYLAAFSITNDDDIVLVDLKTRELAGVARNLRNRTGDLLAMRFTPDGQRFVTMTNRIAALSVPHLDAISSFRTTQRMSIPESAMSADGHFVYLTTVNDISSAVEKYDLAPSLVIVDKKRYSTPGAWGTIKLGRNDTSVGFGREQTMTIWRGDKVATRNFGKSLLAALFNPSPISDFELTPDGKTVLVSHAGKANLIRSYSADDFSQQFELPLERINPFGELAVSKTGKFAAVVESGGQLKLFDLNSKELVTEISTELEANTARLEFFPNETKLAVVGRQAPQTTNELLESDRPSQLLVIDIVSQEIVARREQGFAIALKFLNDDQLCIGFLDTQQVEIVDTDDLTTQDVWHIGDEIHALAVANTEPVLACGTRHGNVYLWDTEHHTPLASFAILPPGYSADWPIEQLLFAEDDQRLRYATEDSEGQIRFDIGRQRIEMNDPQRQSRLPATN